MGGCKAQKAKFWPFLAFWTPFPPGRLRRVQSILQLLTAPIAHSSPLWDVHRLSGNRMERISSWAHEGGKDTQPAQFTAGIVGAHQSVLDQLEHSGNHRLALPNRQLELLAQHVGDFFLSQCHQAQGILRQTRQTPRSVTKRVLLPGSNGRKAVAKRYDHLERSARRVLPGSPDPE